MWIVRIELVLWSNFLWEPDIPLLNKTILFVMFLLLILRLGKVLCSFQMKFPIRTIFLNVWITFQTGIARKSVAVCLRLKDKLIQWSLKGTCILSTKVDVKSRLKANYTPVTVVEIQRAERKIIRLVQREAFNNEYRFISPVAVTSLKKVLVRNGLKNR